MSFPCYSDYKDSGVAWLGKVPGHWEVVRLASLFKEVTEDGQDGLPILSVSIHDGVSDKQLDEDELDKKVSRSEDTSKYKKVLPGDLVYNMMRAWQGGFGSVAITGMVSPAYVVARPTKLFLTQFIEFLLRTPCAVEEMRRQSQGVTDFRLRLYWEKFKSMKVSIPSKAEQSTIIAFLDRETTKIDALVMEQERLIELLKEKRQAVISHAVTKGLNPDAPMKDSGIEWLGEVPAHWGRAKKLADLAARYRHSFVNGPFGSDLLTSELTTEGVPVIYIRDLKSVGYQRVSEWCVTLEKAMEIAFCNVLPDDILIAKVGDPPGLAVVYPQEEPEGIVTQDVIRLRVDLERTKPRFLVFLLNSDYGRALIDSISVESTRTRVSLGDYKTLRFILPPLKEQSAIVAYLDEQNSKLNTLAAEAQHAIDLLKERRSALISAAVTGQIDVRGLVVSNDAPAERVPA